MTITMFMTLVTIFSIISSFLTEGIKKWFTNANKSYSANLIALINAVVIGCCGTPIAYVIMDVPFNAVNIVFIIIMAGVTWLGSMLGYDKVKQLIAQIIGLKGEA